jgi:hypothetical protein
MTFFKRPKAAEIFHRPLISRSKAFRLSAAGSVASLRIRGAFLAFAVTNAGCHGDKTPEAKGGHGI